MQSKGPFLATYGTLMRAFGRQKALGVADALSFEGGCTFRGALHDLGAYPGAVPGEGTVQAELFRLPAAADWDVLDRYEGYDPGVPSRSLFVRRPTQLLSPDTTAWVYWYTGPIEGHPRVPKGDWRAYVESTGEDGQ